ncbi:6-bladed beta-propeller [Gemmatimonadota bacterium]
MYLQRHLVLTPLVLCLLTACSAGSGSDSETSHSFQVFEEDGVTISESSSEPKYEGDIFTFEEIFELEQDESRPETLLNVAAGYLMDEEGRIFVFDYGDCRIAVFNQNGKYLRDIGRQGAGPGEFSHIRYRWMKDGVIAVYDALQYRATTFTTEGMFLNSYTRPGTSNIMRLAPIMRRLMSIYPLPDGRMVQMLDEQRQFGTEEQARRSTAVLVSSAGDSLHSFSTEWMETPVYPARGGGVIGKRTMFTVVPALQVYLDRGILIADPREPIARWYDLEGNLTRILRLGLEPEPVTGEERTEIERYYRELIQNSESPQKERLEENWQFTVIPDYKSFWYSFLVDDQGFHWLRNHDDWTQPAEVRRQYSYKVYSPEGEYLGSATWPSRVASITRGHFLGRQLDEETDGYRYFVYRITPAVEGLEY